MNSTFQRIFAPVLYILIFFGGFLTAFLWFDPQTYRANLLSTMTAVSLFGAVWLVYAALSDHTRRHDELHRRSLLIQQESIQPVVNVMIRRAEDYPHLLVMMVRNAGKGLAKNIRFRVQTAGSSAAEEAVAAALMKLIAVQNGIDQLAAGETYAAVFADSNTLAAELPERKFGGTVKIIADCCNVFDQTGTTESVLDLSVLNGFHRPEPAEKPRKLLY